MFEYDDLDATALAQLVREKEVSPLELVDAAIAQIEKRNPALNAIVTPMFDEARKLAAGPLPDGPFTGVPFLLKDLVATVKGVPTSAGNRHLAKIAATEDSELVKRWKRSGVIILGKTTTPEFGLTPYTESLFQKPTRNPWDTSRTPGGSSGGSAAAVASRMVPFASGGDGGGSIRIPSSACGLFGMKPTRGRTPCGPVAGEGWKGLAIEHVLTRSVRDSATMLDATHGADIGAPYHAPHYAGSWSEALLTPVRRLKIAVSKKPMLGNSVEPAVAAAFDESVLLLTSLGHEVVEAAPVIDREAYAMALVTILAGEMRADLDDVCAQNGLSLSAADFDPESLGLGLLGKAFSAADIAKASRYVMSESRKIGQFFEGYDVLMTPVLAQLPVKIGALRPTAIEQRLIRLLAPIDGGWILKRLGIVKTLAAQTFSFLPWTAIFNVTGQPAMSVPLHWTADNLPVGMHFVGRFGDEETLFQLAAELEVAKPWAQRKPHLD